MNVVIISDFATVTGGAPKVAIESALALSRIGVRVVFVYGAAGVDESLKASDVELVDAGLESVWDTPNKFAAAAAGIWNQKALDCVRRELDKQDPSETIVHIHQWTKSFSPSIFAATGRFRTFVTLHDYFFACPTGILFNFQTGRHCELQPMSAACITTHCDSRSAAYKAVRVARQIGEAVALRRRGRKAALSFVHVSEFARQTISKHLPPGHDHYVVPNPVRIAGPGQVQVGRNEKFLFLGRLNPEKGIMQLAAALKEAGLPGLIHGAGPSEAELRAKHPELEFVSWSTSESVYESLNRSRCIVLPTRWNEVQGLSVFEAASVGVPAIVSQNSGAADFVLRSGGGVVIDPHQPPQLVDALKRVAGDDDYVTSLGQNAFHAFRAGISDYGRKLTDLYSGKIEACRNEPAG